MYRPQFIEPENMKALGFDIVSDNGDYLKYRNNATINYNKHYNKDFPEPKGKVILYINTVYDDNCFFLLIAQDGDTRTVYNGICDTEVFLKQLLYSIR